MSDYVDKAREQIRQYRAGTWTPPVLNPDDMRAALQTAATTPPVVTRFEVPPDVDDMLQGLAGVTTNTPTVTPSPYAITAVEWTVDPDLPPRTIRTHYSDGTSKVHDL